MAKNKKSKRKPAVAGTGVATAGEDPDDGRARPADEADPAAGGAGGADWPADHARVATAGSGGSGPFTVYKPGQGYYTRTATALSAAVVAVFGAHHVYANLSSDNPAWQLGIPTVFLAICAAVIFWIVGVNRRANDFFIATEGEMKKVSWSSRREVIGSTKVVMAFTFLMAFLLFIVDIIFMAFFSWIGVLDINLLEAIGWKVNG